MKTLINLIQLTLVVILFLLGLIVTANNIVLAGRWQWYILPMLIANCLTIILVWLSWKEYKQCNF